MNKRLFLKALGAGLFLTPFQGMAAPSVFSGGSRALNAKKPSALLPPGLKKGDTIGIISPSATLFEEMPFQLAREAVEALGFQVRMGRHVGDRYGHLAGTDKERADDLNSMFADTAVKGIICFRGGSGAARILDLIDYDSIRKNPKVFMGYSDITALHMAIYTQTGLVTFHGPMATSVWPSYNASQFESLFVRKELPTWRNPQHKGDDLIVRENRIRVIRSGQASGELLGGNLTVLSGIAGSRYFPDFEGKILFLEDVGEELYRIDRMMSQLQLTGALGKLAGFVFGRCSDCGPGEGYGSLTLDEILDHYIQPLGIPAYSGALIGHISRQFILPLGARVQMDAAQGSIRLLEGVFS